MIMIMSMSGRDARGPDDALLGARHSCGAHLLLPSEADSEAGEEDDYPASSSAARSIDTGAASSSAAVIAS
ncbi:hypothetical protein, partial [Reyranella sp.]|uniref:hypothetical protein n=1 Tax=Reyranella sp. TaxID=1929291 RepID=UPI003D0A1F2C